MRIALGRGVDTHTAFGALLEITRYFSLVDLKKGYLVSFSPFSCASRSVALEAMFGTGTVCARGPSNVERVAQRVSSPAKVRVCWTSCCPALVLNDVRPPHFIFTPQKVPPPKKSFKKRFLGFLL
jgi:hypothetical protein